jgi:GxxExxY protein
LESAYRAILTHELIRRGLNVQSEVILPITYDGITIDTGYRADLVVENLVIDELKSVEKIQNVHQKQVLTYLKVSGLHLGLSVNFGAPMIREGIKRIVNGLQE